MMKRQKFNQNDDDDDHHHQEHIDRFKSLPLDMILDIASRLPVKSIIQFRFVCKNFYKLSHDPLLFHMQLSKALSSNTCLIFHCDYPLNNQLHFVELLDHGNNLDEKVRKFRTPFSKSMPEFNVIGSCNGLLCLVNSLFRDVVYIYNPFTSQYRELPRSVEFQDQDVMYGFGFHPISQEYKVIKITYYANMYNAPLRSTRFVVRRYTRTEVQVFSLGDSKWRSIGEIPYQLDRKSTVALVNGRLHWVSKYGMFNGRYGKRIVSFDLSDELFREIGQPDCVSRTTLNSYHLAVLEGCLCIALASRRRGNLDIWMMKEYGVEESWVKQFCIEDYSPEVINQGLKQPYKIWKNVLTMRFVRVLCLLENGEILLEYKCGTLASYNPDSGRVKDVMFPGMPNMFQTIVHVGSLNWI